jgi:predicted esterase YcpF (UPF0227 family)
MILFIHGFGSCGWGAKSLLLRRHFGVAGLLAPDLPFEPLAAMARLREIIGRYHVRALIGSSLGGFYATALNADHGLPAVLINPVIAPHRLLAAYLGPQRRWCDDARFEVGGGYLETLQQLYRPSPARTEHYLVLLQTGDEVLDYRDAERYYADHEVNTSAGGNHRFEGLERYLPTIDAWLAKHGVDGG